MPIIFIKDFRLESFDSEAAIKIDGIWRRVKGYYDMDEKNGGTNASFICKFGNGYVKATYPDVIMFVVNPTDENIHRTICECNMDEISAEYNRKIREEAAAKAREDNAALIADIIRRTQERPY